MKWYFRSDMTGSRFVIVPGDAGVADGCSAELPQAMAPTGPDTKAWGKRTQGAQPQDEQRKFRSPERAGYLANWRKAVPPLQGLRCLRANSRGAAPGFVVWPLQGRFCYRMMPLCRPARQAVSWSILSKPAQYHHGRQFP